MPLGKATRLPHNHGVGAVVLAAARGRAAAAARPAHVTLGWRRALAAAEGARRPSRPLACQARPAALPGGVADLGGSGGLGLEASRCTIAVESKIGVDLGRFFVVFAVAIWRWGKRLKFNVENSASAPWLLSARQKLA